MRLNRSFIVCCISVVLIAFAGCKKVVKVNVNRALVPLSATVTPGDTLEWVALSPDEQFDVVVQSGLCTQTSPLHASYGHPAICTIAKQPIVKPSVAPVPPGAAAPPSGPAAPSGTSNQTTVYTYHIEGQVDGKPVVSPQFSVQVGPGGCTHC